MDTFLFGMDTTSNTYLIMKRHAEVLEEREDDVVIAVVDEGGVMVWVAGDDANCDADDGSLVL